MNTTTRLGLKKPEMADYSLIDDLNENMDILDESVSGTDDLIGYGKYSNQATYNIGDTCIQDNNIYSCTTTISTPEEWNPSHWEQIGTVSDVLDKLGNCAFLNYEVVSTF